MPILPPTQSVVRIAILAYPGCMGTQVFGIAEVLRLAVDMASTLRPDVGTQLRIEVIGLRGRSVAIAGTTVISTQIPRGRYDVLIVPGMEITRHVDWTHALAPLNQEIAFTRKAYAAGTPVASVCVGAFLLGEAGLLNGRQATTAWLFAQALGQRYAHTRVDASAILLEDGGVITTGAVSSAFDLAVYLVKHLLGADIATAVARVTLLPSQRHSQKPFVDTALLPQRLPSFAQQVQQWLDSRLSHAFVLNELAAAFCVSTSTLLRRVKAQTGQSPLGLLQAARVERAKQLMLSTSWGLARITETVGYADVASFTRLFKRLVGESPAQYRRQHT